MVLLLQHPAWRCCKLIKKRTFREPKSSNMSNRAFCSLRQEMRPEIRCTQVTTFGDKTYQVKGSFGHLDPFKKQGLPCLRTHVALADTAI